MNNWSSLSDHDLIKQTKVGQIEAYSEIIRRWQQKIYGFLYRLTQERTISEDLTQETFVKAYLKLETFKIDKKFSSWLFAIAHNLTVNWWRQQNRLVSLEEARTKSDQSLTTEQKLDISLTNQKINQALKKLDNKYKIVIELYYFQELSYQEIGEITKLPLNTVKIHLHRAKKLLADNLKDLWIT